MVPLALAFLVALTGPASAEPISIAILGALAIEATKTAVLVTTFLLSAALSVATSVAQKLLTPKPKKTAPTNLDSSMNVTTRETLAPRRLVYGRTRLGGTIVFSGTSDNNLFLHMVIAFCEGEIDAFETIYFNDVAVVIDNSGLVQSSPYNLNNVSYAFVAKHTGSPTQAADNTLPLYISNWTSDHKLSGVAYLYVRLQWDANAYATGLPNISAVVRGARVYDPRTGNTAWSDNPALCIRDYLLRPHAKGGVGAAPDEVDDTNIIAQANICDELIPLWSGGSERRYTLNGVIQMDSANSPQATLESMLTSCAGTMPWTSGVFFLFVGTWRTPTATLTDEMQIGPLKVQPRRPMREQFNAVKGSFVNPAARYEAADYPAVTSPTFEEEDGGVQIFRELTLEFTQSAAMAQRISKIELYRSREPITIQAVCSLYAYQICVGDVVNFTHERYGWENKAFECTGWRWTVATADSAPSLAIELTLRETSSAVYDWSISDEQLLAAAPATSLPKWTEVGGVLTLTLAAGTSELLLAGDGTVVSRIKVSWAASIDAFVSKYEVRWKKNTDTAFGVAVTVGVDAAPVYYISPVEDGTIYVVQVRALSILGATSDWTSGTVTVLGKTEPPADIVNARINNGILAWDYPNPPADLEGFKVRYQTGSYSFWPSGVDAHSGLLSSGQLDVSSLLSGTVTLMVKAIDTSGNESVRPAIVVANLGDYVVQNVVVTYDLHAAGFPGTIAEGALDAGDLAGLSTSKFWSSNPNSPFYPPQQARFWRPDIYTDVDWSFTYTPDSNVAGSTMSIASTILGNPWAILYREIGPSRFWTGTPSAAFWRRGSSRPMWLSSGEFTSWPGFVTARQTRYEFRIKIGGGGVQPRITAFSLVFDVPDISETLGDVAIAAAGTPLPITKSYRVITGVNLTVQAGVNAPVSARTESKLTSGPVVKAFNAAGVAVDATVDAIVQGY